MCCDWRFGRPTFTGLLDCKPVSVSPCGAAIIHLGQPLLAGSSDLPGSGNGAGRSSSPIWSCSAWGLPCQTDCSARGALLPHLFTLTGNAGRSPATGGIFSVALSVKSALSESPRPLAGMLPFGDRTFLPPLRLPAQESGCPSARSATIVARLSTTAPAHKR